MLLMLGTQPTVEGTTTPRFDRKADRKLARQAVLHPIKPAIITAHKIFTGAVLQTLLQKINATVSRHDLRGNDSEALRTQTLSRSKKSMITQLQSGHLVLPFRSGTAYS
jgi:hypothetical protein